jgi:sulfate transport system substrate-binding protein
MRYLKSLHLHILWIVAAWPAGFLHAEATFLNVSYDVTREFYQEFNVQFAPEWAKTSSEKWSSTSRMAGPQAKCGR